ncbi:flavin-containing monooxygenase [Pseudonocardia sp. GCM10023141]|uniref:flavin-containing monooxygenase n=1 Tax=Pseudonocardia sp. GCM10023141 TaxID=3252653 RepID=UPI00361BD298
MEDVIPIADTEPAASEQALIGAALETADINALRVALYQVTGNEELAAMRLQRREVRDGAAFVEVVAPADVPRVKALATEYLLRRRESPVPPPPDRTEQRRLVELLVGGPMLDAEFAMAVEELAMATHPHDAEWTTGRPSGKVDEFHVVVVGGGISGIAAAVQLKRLGVSFTVVEREPTVGGVWRRNTYPDARVDSPSVGYQFKFMQDFRWSEPYPSQGEILKYLDTVVERYDLAPHFRFGLEVTAARWDEECNTWEVSLADREGEQGSLVANVVITACGLFNMPKLPDVPGMDTFRGTILHSSAWPDSTVLQGKRVAVIGNGSTGVQLMPRVGEAAEFMAVFQRTPSWIVPVDSYKATTSPAEHWLLDALPYYWNWHVLSSFIADSRLFLGAQKYDRAWQADGGLISAANDKLRRYLTSYITSRMAPRPELVDKLVPTYAPLGRRVVADNGYYSTLLRDNVELVTEDIERFTPEGIVTVDGSERQFDIVVAATGYHVMRYLWPADYVGRDGQTLSETWRPQGPRAFVGMTVPGFPNLFMMGGPNGQPRAGNFHSWAETFARYIASAVVHMIENDVHSIEVRSDVFDDYNRRLDEAFTEIIWSTEAAGGYYKVEKGMGAVSMPWEHYEFHDLVRCFDVEAFILK